ncbi:SCO3374 family protein [Streptomyces sp. NPDC097619]|uniref:SCO3374 family protein n=1 Tax=Streptomyces sp. NPDC097619 TaxID=3157228 RepID=UPI00332B36B9
MRPTVPPPRTPLEGARPPALPLGRAARWYADELGWPVTAGEPARLLTGTTFDVLELPADAGASVLDRGVATGPVALLGRRMRFLVAAGAAEELEGLLAWLEWGGVALDLTALGAGGRILAPVPPGRAGEGCQGAAVWLRPPVPGCGALLPALTVLGRSAGSGAPGGAPDLVRLVGAAATECHRARLLRTRRTAGQALAFS